MLVLEGMILHDIADSCPQDSESAMRRVVAAQLFKHFFENTSNLDHSDAVVLHWFDVDRSDPKKEQYRAWWRHR